ncbi:hypothetical protein ACE6H2_007773 [Prunus campanulata]
MYPTYTCSPPLSGSTKAYLTLNSFEAGGDGGGPSECDNKYHNDNTPVVALSTGWYSNGGRCHNNITISANGRSVVAMVVDECDSTEGCGDGGGPSECDNKYHNDNTPVVALSTGWYNNGGRCHNNITISANGRSVVAMVVDECDSTEGCDADHDYQPPCPNNIVDASKAVWKALGVPEDNWGGLDITWSDA